MYCIAVMDDVHDYRRLLRYIVTGFLLWFFFSFLLSGSIPTDLDCREVFWFNVTQSTLVVGVGSKDWSASGRVKLLLVATISASVWHPTC